MLRSGRFTRSYPFDAMKTKEYDPNRGASCLRIKPPGERMGALHYSNDIAQACASLRKCGFDVLQTLFCLLEKTVGNRRIRVVEACCAEPTTLVP
jgi:hypothetical protein